jgi:hypothetical protein
MLYPLSYGGGYCRRCEVLGVRLSVSEAYAIPWGRVIALSCSDFPRVLVQALSCGAGTRPPTEVGARALRFCRPARCGVARLRTTIGPKGARQ